jgi:hypothetical protein
VRERRTAHAAISLDSPRTLGTVVEAGGAVQHNHAETDRTMGMDLSIGQLGLARLQDDAIAYLASLGLTERQHISWTNCADNTDWLCLLNLASVCLFLDHVSELEGFPDANAALERTRFRQLPWWESSIWLPIAFTPPTLLDDGGCPVLLGSCQQLLGDLEEVRRLSHLSMSTTPRGYEQMRSDIKAFCRSGFQLDDDASIIQWIWRALYDGPNTAIDNSAVLSSGPG